MVVRFCTLYVCIETEANMGGGGNLNEIRKLILSTEQQIKGLERGGGGNSRVPFSTGFFSRLTSLFFIWKFKSHCETDRASDRLWHMLGEREREFEFVCVCGQGICLFWQLVFLNLAQRIGPFKNPIAIEGTSLISPILYNFNFFLISIYWSASFEQWSY